MIKDAEIEKALSSELEGKVFEHVWISNYGDTFFLSKDYYTVKQGHVFFIGKEGDLQPSGDTLLTLKSESLCIGNYDRTKLYVGVRKSMTQSEIKKALDL